MAWLQENKIDKQPTGKFAIAKIGPKKGKTGEIVKVMEWGGYILRFDDGTEITYAFSDCETVL